MNPHIEISFDCLPLRSVGPLDVPVDTSPTFQALCERIKRAIGKHGVYNSYYLHNAKCVFRLTNDEQIGMLEFGFEGTVLTDPEDIKTLRSDLQVQLERETCEWLTEPVVDWFCETVNQAVVIEFDRYIAAGDLEQTVQRAQQIQAQSDSEGGFVGLGL